ncbi:MAG: hypothetical protein LLG00_03710 [Planctomycetaceae bacterium]|nr:hypothetical protein [Planctomycetaceae bacterium]
MNLVGKIFVVLIFVFSLVFMSLAMAVYATHKNWREDVTRAPDKVGGGKELGLKYQLDNAKKENQRLKDEREAVIKQLESERIAKAQALAKLRTAYDVKEKDLRQLESGYAREKKDTREAVAATNATQKNASDYYQELQKQLAATLEAQQDRDKYFKDLVQKDDELNQARNELEQLRNRDTELSKDLGKYKEMSRWFGLPGPDGDYKSKTPPRVDGLVTATPGAGLVEIDLGSDQGIRKGHRLEVYRIGGGQNAYVGRVEVMRVAATSAVCKIDPKYQNSNVMVGDRVGSRID